MNQTDVKDATTVVSTKLGNWAIAAIVGWVVNGIFFVVCYFLWQSAANSLPPNMSQDMISKFGTLRTPEYEIVQMFDRELMTKYLTTYGPILDRTSEPKIPDYRRGLEEKKSNELAEKALSNFMAELRYIIECEVKQKK